MRESERLRCKPQLPFSVGKVSQVPRVSPTKLFANLEVRDNPKGNYIKQEHLDYWTVSIKVLEQAIQYKIISEMT